MSVDVEELRRLAEAATPGPWFVGTWYGRCPLDHRHGRGDCKYSWTKSEGWTGTGTSIGSQEPGIDVVGSDYDGAVMSEPNARFIAAANPAAVLALLERVRRLEDAARSVLKWTDFKDTDEYEALEEALKP